MAIQNIESMQLTEHIVLDASQDAVVIDGVSKIFKKSQPLVRLPWKQYKEVKREVHAVDNVTMTVKRREIMGILGANGSGKSTLIRMLSTLLMPDTGHLTIFGCNRKLQSRERFSPHQLCFCSTSPRPGLILDRS